MEVIARIVLVSEILLVNLLTSHWCMKKKYSTFRTVLALASFSIVLFSLLIGLRVKANLSPYGGVFLIFVGFIYILPLKHLYEASLEKIVTIMLFSWTHSLSVRFIASEIVFLTQKQEVYLFNLFLQTAIFLLTTPLLIRFINRKFSYVINHIPQKLSKYLHAISLLQCFLVSVIAYKSDNLVQSMWPLLLILMVVLMAGLNYSLVYIIVKDSVNTAVLEHLVYKDSLTETDNRLSFFLECKKRIQEGQPFTTVYMDIDNLKKVNDIYGHSSGDNYLKSFTKAVKDVLGPGGKLFRLSGDEFVCLLWQEDGGFLPEAFEARIHESLVLDIPFLGVSIGYSLFPRDGMTIESLLSNADRMMYKTKEIRRQGYFERDRTMSEKQVHFSKGL